MFSIHIDTARTWRGGQNQVLLTVLGLRALGHRTVLIAHAAGELRQRAHPQPSVPRELSLLLRVRRPRQQRPQAGIPHRGS